MRLLLNIASVLLGSLPHCNAFLGDIGASSSRHRSEGQQLLDNIHSTPQNDYTVFNSENTFGEINLPLEGAGDNIWSSGLGHQHAYLSRGGEDDSLHAPLLNKAYELLPYPSSMEESGGFGHGSYQDAAYSYTHNLPSHHYQHYDAGSSPSQILLDQGMHYHGHDAATQFFPDISMQNFAGTLPYHYAVEIGQSSSEVPMDTSASNSLHWNVPGNMMDSIVPPFPPIRTTRNGLDGSSAGSSIRHPDWYPGRRSDEELGVRQPQTARVDGHIRGLRPMGVNAPSTSRVAPILNKKKDNKDDDTFSRWLKQEWDRRELHTGLHAQTLAGQVAEIKIMWPEKAIPIGRVSSIWIHKAKRIDAWYLYDYDEWTETYRKRINSLRSGFAKKKSPVLDRFQLRQMLLTNFRDTTPKHYAMCADQQAQAAEVERAKRVWEAFKTNALGERLNKGEQLSLNMIAEQSLGL